MKQTILLLGILLLCPSLSGAQTVAGRIGWYEDRTADDCDLHVPPGVHVEYWLVHGYTSNVKGATFKTLIPSCLNFLSGGTIWTWGPDPNFTPPTHSAWVTSGSYDVEITFDYRDCRSGFIVLAQLEGFGAQASVCCELGVYPGDYSGFLVWLCDGTPIPWNLGEISYLNGDYSCPCYNIFDPVGLSTWGAIKALYGAE